MFNLLKTKNVTQNTKLLNMLQDSRLQDNYLKPRRGVKAKKHKRGSVHKMTSQIQYHLRCWEAGRAGPVYFYVFIFF